MQSSAVYSFIQLDCLIKHYIFISFAIKELFDKLVGLFSDHQTPIGLISKLLTLSEYDLDMIIDDSSSMAAFSDVEIQGIKLSRWQEAENRLHILIDILAYIPIKKLTIRFLNRNTNIELSHEGKTPEKFAKKAHEKIKKAFKDQPNGSTPIYSKLKQAFKITKPTIHYLFTDGVPSDTDTETIEKLVKSRDARQHPICFLSCTDNTSEAQWMKELEQNTDFASEIDDFDTEKNEVISAQGPIFPYNQGFWLLSHLIAPINPDDLDALDEAVPFTRKTMTTLMGYQVSEEQYKQYFFNNPVVQKRSDIRDRFSTFARLDLLAKQIVDMNSANKKLLPDHLIPTLPANTANLYQYPLSAPTAASAAAAAYTGYQPVTGRVSQTGMWGPHQYQSSSTPQEPSYPPPAYSPSH